MRRALGDAVISLTGLIVLLLILASVDQRVREYATNLIGGAASTSALAGTGKDIGGLIAVVYDAVKYQSVAHAPLVLFAIVATVLVLFMVRT